MPVLCPDPIKHNEVLTLHRDYFRLRKPIERRIYELARKHCGQQPSWKASIEVLHRKSGSKSTDKEFRRAVRNLAASDHLPDYMVSFDAEHDMVLFTNRNTMKIGGQAPEADPWEGRLSGDVFNDVRSVAPGWDPYYLEGEWRRWVGAEEIQPKHPERHFVKFAQSWFEKRGKPA